MFAAETWSRRVVWMLLATVAWGQIAAAHAGLGTLMGSITLIAFIAFRVTGLVRSGRWAATATAGFAAAFVAALAGVNLMFLAPQSRRGRRDQPLPRISAAGGARTPALWHAAGRLRAGPRRRPRLAVDAGLGPRRLPRRRRPVRHVARLQRALARPRLAVCDHRGDRLSRLAGAGRRRDSQRDRTDAARRALPPRSVLDRL